MIKYKSFSTSSQVATTSGHLYDIEVIKEDVLSLLLTRKFDYPQDPTIGCVVHDYVYNPTINEDEEAEIKEDLLEQLGKDPRLENINIHIENSGEDLMIAIYADIKGIDEQLFMNVSLKE